MRKMREGEILQFSSGICRNCLGFDDKRSSMDQFGMFGMMIGDQMHCNDGNEKHICRE